MPGRFDIDCRRVIGLAQEQARGMGHPFLGTEHLLLALLSEPDDVTTMVMQTANVDPNMIRREVLSMIGPELDSDALSLIGIDLHRVREIAEEQFGRGALSPVRRPGRIKGHFPATRRLKVVLRLSDQAANRLGNHTIRPAHLLLGMLDDGGGIAIRALKDAHVPLPELRRDIATRLEQDAA